MEANYFGILVAMSESSKNMENIEAVFGRNLNKNMFTIKIKNKSLTLHKALVRQPQATS